MLKRVLSIIVAIAILCTTAIFAFAETTTELSVAVTDADLRPGDKTTATVQLNNYADNWSAMSIDVTYDADLFDLDGETLEDAVSYSGFIANAENGMVEIYEVPDTNKTLRIVWMAPSNIQIEGDLAIDLVTLNLVAKEGVQGSEAITAQLAEDGQLSIDPETEELTEIVAGTGTFSAAVASSDPVVIDGIPWDEQPVLRMELEKNRIQVENTGYAIIYIDKYIPWSQLSVDFSIPDGCLEITEVEPIGFTGEAVISGSNVTITAAGDVSGEGNLTDGSLKAMKVTFTGVSLHEAFDLTASFEEGGQANTTDGTLKGDVHYQMAGDTKSVSVVPKKTDLAVSIDAPENLQAGQEFDVYVNLLEHENEWAAFSLVGSYDPAMFAVVDIDTESYLSQLGTDANGSLYTAVEPERLTDDLEVIWFSTGNIKMDSTNPTVMKIRFKALQAATAESISFTFKDDGVIAEGENGALETQKPGDNFTNEEKEVSVDVKPAPMYFSTSEIPPVKAGETFSVIVSVHDYYEKLAALSIKGSYDKAQFDLVGVESLLTFGEYGTVSLPDVEKVNAGEEELEIVWISVENVALEPNFEAVKLTFKAKEQADAAQINFNFIEDGVLRMGSDNLPETLAGGTYYKEEAHPATVEITVPSVEMEVVSSKDSVVAGEEFTVEVYVTDYYSPLAGFAIEGALDKTKYKVTGIQAETIGGVEPIQDENNEEELEFVWYSFDNIEAGSERFKAVTLTLLALESTDDTQDAIAFDYMDGGMVRITSSGVTALERGVDYPQNATVVEVPVAAHPVELSIELEQDTVMQGDTFDVAVSLNYYEDNWSILSFKTLFDTNLFEVVEANIVNEGGFPGDMAYSLDNATNPLAFSFVNYDNVAADGMTVPLVTFTLRAKADATLGEATVGAEFMENGMLTFDGSSYATVAHDGVAYSLAQVTDTIEILEADSVVEFNVSWGALSYSYEFGTWNVESHEWIGAGWTCEENADKITVENIGSVGISAGFEFTKNGESPYDLTNLSGAFTYEDAPLAGEITVAAGGPAQTVLFALSGKTEQVWEDQQTVGEITVTITADGAIDEEVTQ